MESNVKETRGWSRFLGRRAEGFPASPQRVCCVCFPVRGGRGLRERVQWLVALKWCGWVGPGPICLLASLGPAGPHRILADTHRCENPPGGHWVPGQSCLPGGHLRPGAPVRPAHCWSACWDPSPVTHPAWLEEAAHSPGSALAHGVLGKSAPSETLPAASQGCWRWKLGPGAPTPSSSGSLGGPSRRPVGPVVLWACLPASRGPALPAHFPGSSPCTQWSFPNFLESLF